MRVLQVVEASSAGVGRHVADLSLGLAERGHDVRVLWGPERSDERFRRAMDELEAAGGSHREEPMERAPSRSDLRLLRTVGEEIAQFRPDVVHGQSSKGGAVARIAGRKAGVPSAYTPHAYVTLSPGLSQRGFAVYRAAERTLAKLGRLTVCVSEFERNHAVERLGLDPAKITVIPNGIAGPVFADRDVLRQAWSVPSGATVVGWVGRFSPQKNPLLFAEAFARAARERDDLYGVMVGDGELRPEVEEVFLQREMRYRVHLPGAMDGATAMNGFDLFALTSDYEGYPYVVLEALAAGLPVASTDIGAVHEVLGEGSALAPPGDPDAMAQAILRTVGGKADASRVLTADEMVKRTEAAYAELLSGRSAAW